MPSAFAAALTPSFTTPSAARPWPAAPCRSAANRPASSGAAIRSAASIRAFSRSPRAASSCRRRRRHRSSRPRRLGGAGARALSSTPSVGGERAPEVGAVSAARAAALADAGRGRRAGLGRRRRARAGSVVAATEPMTSRRRVPRPRAGRRTRRSEPRHLVDPSSCRDRSRGRSSPRGQNISSAGVKNVCGSRTVFTTP